MYEDLFSHLVELRPVGKVGVDLVEVRGAGGHGGLDGVDDELLVVVVLLRLAAAGQPGVGAAEEADQGELGGDAGVDARGRLADVEPDARAGQQAQQGVAPVDQEHQHELHRELQEIIKTLL